MMKQAFLPGVLYVHLVVVCSPDIPERLETRALRRMSAVPFSSEVPEGLKPLRTAPEDIRDGFFRALVSQMMDTYAIERHCEGNEIVVSTWHSYTYEKGARCLDRIIVEG